MLRAAAIIYSDAELLTWLCGLSMAAYVDLWQAEREGLPYPDLYSSGIRYQREPPGSEVWQIPRATYASKVGDCEDLAAGYRVPWLWLHGETLARPYVLRPSAKLRHVLVERADGSIEDPSLCLGMREKREPGSAAKARATLRPVVETWHVRVPFDLPVARSIQ